ncbi:hypothetical protein ENBRE01_0714 [Enteropsectra breve]|nr:hypothetical protein ENBRE01_0714 [Enteropsectra breve]
MIRLVSFITFLVSNISANSGRASVRRSPFNLYTAADKMMLVPFPRLNEKIENNISCLFCKYKIIKTEKAPFGASTINDSMNISNGSVSINYFRCPQCECIGHLNCLFEKSKDRVFACPNPNCILIFKSNDLNRLFAQLFYVFVHRGANFADYKKIYNLYLSKEGDFSHAMLMNILTESKTLQDIDQKKLWKDVQVYFGKNILDFKGYFKVYYNVLNTGHANFVREFDDLTPLKVKELFETGTLLNSISRMSEEFKAIFTSQKLLALYNKYVEKAASNSLRKKLAAHFIHLVMEFHNPLMCLEEIYIHKAKSNDLVIKAPLAADILGEIIENPSQYVSMTEDIKEDMAHVFLFYLLTEFENNNIYRIVQMARIYCRLDNKGVFIPALINFFASNGRPDIVKEIIDIQLKKLNISNLHQKISLNNAIFVITVAVKGGFSTTMEHIEEILNWMRLWQSDLSIGEMKYINSLLEAHMAAPKNKESIIIIQNYFVKHHSPKLVQIYMRCMPKEYYSDDALLGFREKRQKHFKALGVKDHDTVADIEHKKRLAIRETILKEAAVSGDINQVLN